jgi:hypothetical protein
VQREEPKEQKRNVGGGRMLSLLEKWSDLPNKCLGTEAFAIL